MTGLVFRLSNFYFWYFAFVGVFAPFFSLYLQRRGFAPFEIAILLGISPALRILVPFFWAWLSDRWGEKYRLIVLLALIGPLIFFFIRGGTSLPYVATILTLWGLVWSGILPIAEALCAERLGNQLSIYGRIRLWGSVGFILVVLGGGYLFEMMDLIHLDYVMSLMLVLVTASIVFLPKDLTHQGGVSSVRGGPALKVDRRIIGLLLCFFMMQFAHGAYNAFFSIFIVENGYSKSTVGWLWAVAVIAEIFIFLIMPRLFSRFRFNDFFLFCFVIAVLRFSLVAVGFDSIILLIFSQMMHAITFGMFHVAGIAATNEYFTGVYRSRGQALYSSVGFGAGGALGTFASGLLWERFDGPTTFVFSAGVAFIGAGLIYWLRRHDGIDTRSS